MANFNTFVVNSIERFDQSSPDPLNLSQVHDVNVNDKSTPFQVTGRIFDVQFFGLSLLATRSPVLSDIADNIITIDAIIPCPRISGRYKLAVGIGSDVSLTASGSWYIVGKTYSHAYLRAVNWGFKKLDDDTVSMTEDATFEFSLFHEHGYEGYEDFFPVFKDLFSGPESQGLNENTKIAIYQGLSKTIHEMLEPILGARIFAKLREHLQEDFQKVSLFEVMDGCIVPPREKKRAATLGLPPPTEPGSKLNNLNGPPPVYSDDAESGLNNETAPVDGLTTNQQRKQLEALASDISEVVISTNTQQTEDGMVFDVVTKKTINFKYK